MKRRWKRALSALAIAATVGLAVVASGVVPIAASSGHSPVTEWFLHFAMRRSVATHSLGVPSAPDLDDPALVLRGAGHYEGQCRICHGAPGARMPPLPRGMTPHPPALPERVPELDDDELFYIIRHGVKFTGMPAWPASHRDDEVWSVVAFVRRLPGMSAAEYARLVRGDVSRAEPGLPRVVIDTCARCHGVDGLGRGVGAFPRLAGQRPRYLLASLEAYAEGARGSGIMQPIAAALTDEEMRAASAWYASRPPMSERPFDVEPSPRGRTIATEGIPGARVPACVRCHGPGSRPRRDVYPRLAGQDPDYLVTQLRLFRDDHRGGTPFARVMSTVASHALDEDDMRAVATFYARAPSEHVRSSAPP